MPTFAFERMNAAMAIYHFSAKVISRVNGSSALASAAYRSASRLYDQRLEEHRDIARQNGERIIANPRIALDAITRQQATFTRRDLGKFAHRHSDGLEQFNVVMSAVEGSPELVRLGRDGRG